MHFCSFFPSIFSFSRIKFELFGAFSSSLLKSIVSDLKSQIFLSVGMSSNLLLLGDSIRFILSFVFRLVFLFNKTLFYRLFFWVKFGAFDIVLFEFKRFN